MVLDMFESGTVDVEGALLTKFWVYVAVH